MGDLRDAFDRSVEANRQLVTKVDDGLVEAGRKIADRVDEATALGEGQEVTKALYLVPHLLNVLREMQATPKARLEAGIGKEESGGSKLGKLRTVHGGKSA